MYLLVFLLMLNFTAWSKATSTYKSIKSFKGLEINYLPGTYSTDLNLVFRLPKGKDVRVELVQDNKARKIEGSVKLTGPSIIRFIVKENNTTITYLGYYFANCKHNLPVVGLMVNGNEFFAPNGIYSGSLTKNKSGEFVKSGKAWQKKPIAAYAQFFAVNKLQDELMLDVKTYGGMTLGQKEKSLQLSARKEKYGKAKINMKLFANLPYQAYQHVVLRTSGNDQAKTRLKDLALSRVAERIGLETKASRPVVVYVNGIYWGIHNLREKVNSDYYQYRNHWKSNEFVHVQGSGSSNKFYQSTLNYVKNNYAKQGFANRVNDSIDLENFFNFHIFQTYINNKDYRGNIRFYKHKKGAWRWVVYDTDLACNNELNKHNFIQDRTFPNQTFWYNPIYSYTLLNYLLRNQALKSTFVNQYCFLASSHLRPEQFISSIEKSSDNIREEIPSHVKRRGNIHGESLAGWESNVDGLKKFFIRRNKVVFNHLAEALDQKGMYSVEISQSGNQSASIKLYGGTIKTDVLKGSFFKSSPTVIDATSTNHLYRFSSWSNGEKQPVIKLKATNQKLVAKYTHLPQDKAAKTLRFERMYIRNGKKKGLIFLNIKNVGFDDVELTHVQLYEDVSGQVLELGELNVEAGESIVFASSKSKIDSLLPDLDARVINFNFNDKMLDSVKFNLISSEGFVDSLHANVSDYRYLKHNSWMISKSGKKLYFNHIKKKSIDKYNWDSLPYVYSLGFSNVDEATMYFFFLIISGSIISIPLIVFRKRIKIKAATFSVFLRSLW